MNEELPGEAGEILVSDGFDFPVGPRDPNATVWDTYKVDASLVDPNYQKLFNAWHTGEDWNGAGGGDTDLGDPVYAVSHGTVLEFGYYTPSWGNIILLEHTLPDGLRVWSQYAHLDKILVQNAGQTIRRGDQIGTIGKGEKTRDKPHGRWIAHLHFEIRKNRLPIDAWKPYVDNRSTVLANYYSPTPFIKERRPAIFAVPTTSLPPVIVDAPKSDPAAGLFRKANADNWFTAPFGYQGVMLWTFAAADTETNWAEWRPKLPQSGDWEVSVYIPGKNASTTNARYTVIHANGNETIPVSQSLYANQWVSLGIFPFTAGLGYVRLTDVTGERKRGTTIGFDAIRWEKK